VNALCPYRASVSGKKIEFNQIWGGEDDGNFSYVFEQIPRKG
jgi:hypothetical protein